jgi:hypothetical protein
MLSSKHNSGTLKSYLIGETLSLELKSSFSLQLLNSLSYMYLILLELSCCEVSVWRLNKEEAKAYQSIGFI